MKDVSAPNLRRLCRRLAALTSLTRATRRVLRARTGAWMWVLPLTIALVALAWAAVGPSPTSLLLHAAAMAQETDTDGDTMPDQWETFFGLNPNDPADASGNPDADGLTNAQEYAARRHPVGRFARYFAEGSTGYFDTSVAVLNLSTTDTAHVALALMAESGGVTSHHLTLGPRQRQTISINTVLGVPAAVSIIVESDVPVAADRFMTWGTTGIGASLDSGAPAPGTTWYFAEGATGSFLLYYLFENPGTTPANVTVRYLVEGRDPITKTRTLPPYSRTTIPVNQEDPALAVASVGSIITSDVPIFAERAMYVNAGGALGGGAASAGSNQLATQWYFGEGATGPFFQCFLSLLNPGTTAATATVTYHLNDGSTVTKSYEVPAEGRSTVYFNGEAATDPTLAALATGDVWFTVSSTQPILGERAMWWSTWPWYEGHAALGNTTSAVSWAVPEGRHGGVTAEQTYVLIGNTTTSEGLVRLTLIPDTGAPSTRELAIPPGERLTVNVGPLFALSESRFSVIVDSVGATPAPLAVDYARYRSVNGLPFSGGGAAPAIPVSGVGDSAPFVSATTPAANATGVAVDANLAVTFSEPVTAGAGAFVLECPGGSAIALTNLTASPATTFTLDLATDLPLNTACTLRIVASAITDADTTDPPDTPTANVTVPFTTSACATITLSPTIVPGGTINVIYAPVTFTQTGGTAPVTWSLTSGALPAGMTLSSAGVLAGTPTQSGPFSFTVTVTDVNTCSASVPLSFAILSGPNQAPSFAPGANQTAPEDGGPQSTPWATAISPGPASESGQVVTFDVTHNNPTLFSTAPGISATGTLTYTPVPNANGFATVTVVLRDNGGTAGGGVDTSLPQTFTITVTPVNDAPTFTAGPNQTVAEEAGPQTVAGWATAITTGPADEAGQTVTFNVTGNTNPIFFSAGPAVSPAGDLTYTPAVDAAGTATITLTLSDNGGPAPGNTSAPQTFTITITGVNDAPTLTNATIAYSTVGNTQLHVQGATLPGLASVSDADGVLTKSGPTDIDGPAALAAVALTNFDTGEGTLTLNANGSFTYLPDVGFTGVDSFTVQVTDSVTPVSVTVNVTVTDLVYYVNNETGPNNPPGGDGRSNDAWETLAEAQAGAGPNTTIFIFNGLTATTPLTGSIALKNGQKLLGEGVSLTVGTLGIIVPAGTRPHIVATADAVTVVASTANGDRTGVEIRGLNLTSTTGNAVDASAANAQNLGVRISENTVSGSALDGIIVTAASTGTATLAVHDNTITAGGSGLQIARTAGAVFITTFDDNVVSGATVGSGIIVTGPSVFFDAVPGGALNTVAGGATTIGAPGDGVGVAGMLLTSVTGDLSFTDLDIATGNGAALSVVGTGAFTGAAGTRLIVTNGAGSLLATGGPAAVLTDVTADLQLGAMSSANSTANGVSLTNVGGTFSAPATATITNANTAAFNVSGGAGTITYNGTITDDVGTVVAISGTTGGTKSFTGAISDGNDGDGSGISLTGNTGATITFSGGLLLFTGASAAFTATGGGTVNVCDENPCNPAATGTLVNTITTTTGTALNVANTTIGANNLEFRSITAGTAAGSAGVGINLDTTGTSGGLRVKGTGAVGSGGTIQHKTGANGSTTSGIGIYMNATANVQLAWMQLNDFDNHGIRGIGVTNFRMTDSRITGLSGTEANGATLESAINFANVTGTVTFVNNEITGGFLANIYYDNSSGTTNLNFLTNNVHHSNAAFTGDGFLLEADTSATIVANVSNNTFTANGGDHFNMSLVNNANVDLTFNGNDLNGGQPGALGQGLFILGASYNGTFRYDISNNDVEGNVQGGAIFVNKGSGTGVFSGRIAGNAVGEAGVVGSGSAQAVGIHASARGAGGSHTTLIQNNTVRQYFDRGIVLEAGEGSPALTATVVGNTVSNFADAVNSLHGIHFDFGILSADNAQITIDVRNNLIANAANEAAGGFDFRMRTAGANDTFIAGYSGGNNSANAQAFIDGQNPDGTSFSVTQAATGTYNNGPSSPLPTPTLPNLPPAP